jgi:UDPglucose--hexose-1-phosphate uridylyltransferase
MSPNNTPSELRLDPVSKDWVLIAKGRGKRPKALANKERKDWEASQPPCPFDDLSDQECPTYALYKGKEVALPERDAHTCVPARWSTIALPNKYPAFVRTSSFERKLVGPYQVADGVGFHEVIVTKSHTKDIPEFSPAETHELFLMYRARYSALKDEEFVKHISIFKNSGPRAGATVAHPHAQLITTPVTDPDILSSLHGSLEYFQEHKKCIHCAMIAWDRKDKERIVYENDEFVVLCPFASRVAFEMRVYPKKHSAHFEDTRNGQLEALADAFHAALRKLKRCLKNPDYNYFLHSAPPDGGSYDHYHWHWEILPRTAVWAGYELGTEIEVSVIEPERAAEALRAS